VKIALRTLASGLFGVAFFAVLLFGPAGTLNYWQAWVFIAVFIVPFSSRAAISRRRIRLPFSGG
jgi:hypothetical protein